ncbi:hypothetical protein [Lutibacter sp.]|uniref:hypothetical protein n=1 Tax=Lutibacter sp. TaxID=1925666 RepID=UPI0025BF957C|nr:hypothetical protein [Lutibacter sp.]MCF6181257.1 hypothetical protein [Lutibacter sp.]
MKKILYSIALTTILWSCGGGGDNPPAPTNKAPATPTLTYPTNNLLCINNQLDFQYSSTDPDGDAITYQIQIATDNTFTNIVQTQTATTTSKTITLDKGIAYYWRVKATDSKNASSSYSSIFNFYTEGDGITNYIPFAPELVSPALNAAVTTTTATLQWNGSDADTSDTLTYDVYFDTVNPPTTKVSADQTPSSYTTATLSATTTYYWKVVVKDNQGGQTIGQIWNFKTD